MKKSQFDLSVKVVFFLFLLSLRGKQC